PALQPARADRECRAPAVVPRSYAPGRGRSSWPRHLELLELPQRRIVGEVQMKRCDRDEALFDGVEVRAFCVDEVQLIAPDPVILLATWIDLLDHRIAVPSFALPR